MESNLKRIVMLTHDTNIDRRILLEAESLQKAGWQVTIIANANTSDETVPGFQVIRINSSIKTNFFLALLISLHTVIRKILMSIGQRYYYKIRALFLSLFFSPDRIFTNLFLKTALQYDADIYVAHDLPLLPVAAECARVKNAKLVYDSHELYPYQEYSTQETNIWKKIELAHIKSCDLVTTINESIADFLQQTYHLNTVHVIQNAVWLHEPPLKNQRLFHHFFQLPENSLILLYQGKLSLHHHIATLINAMDYVIHPQVHLVLMGSGTNEAIDALNKIKKKLKKNTHVHFHKAVPQQQLLNYTVCADVGIIPYQNTCLNNYYCTPNKLYEFIAAGIPIITTELVELKHIITQNKIGVVGKTDTPENMAKLIDELFSDASSLQEIKINVHNARQIYNWQVEEKKLVSLYEATIHNNLVY